jgi:hypothetical protein
MQDSPNLNNLDVTAGILEAEWTIVIDTPTAGVTSVIRALEENIPLTQGFYDCCSFVQESGYQRFRALEGSHAGAEGTIQQTPASRIIFSIPTDEALLKRVFETIFQSHVNEEPTIRVFPAFGSRSKLLDDKDNPNRYWNRSDAEQIHGQTTGDSA